MSMKNVVTLLPPVYVPKSPLFIQKQLPVIINTIKELHTSYPNTPITFIFDINGLGLPIAESVQIAIQDLRKKVPSLKINISGIRFVANRDRIRLKENIYKKDNAIHASKKFLKEEFLMLAQQGLINSFHSPEIEFATSTTSLENLSHLNDYLSTIFEIVAHHHVYTPKTLRDVSEDGGYITKKKFSSIKDMIRRMVTGKSARSKRSRENMFIY